MSPSILLKRVTLLNKTSPSINNALWRSSKSRGSLLCTEKDITNQCIRKCGKWVLGKKISLDRKLQLHEAKLCL